MYGLLGTLVLLGATPSSPREASGASVATNERGVATHSVHEMHMRRPPTHAVSGPRREKQKRSVPPPYAGRAQVVYGYLPYWEYGPDEVPWEHLTHREV